MNFIVTFLIAIGLLFVLAYITKRRFGVLGLALAAGAILSAMWVGDLTPLVAQAGIIIVRPPLQSIVASALILAPAIVLLISGPKYTSGIQRTVGAIAFTALAIAFLLPSLGSALVVDGTGRGVYDFFVQYRTVIVTIGLLLAIGDLLVSKTPKHHRE
jgi:hypothetical protein